VRDFGKKQRSVFYLGKKASKNYRVTNFSIFHDFSIILSVITQPVFIAKTCALERLFIEQNSKNKKNQQQQFFSKNFLVSMT
jgi:hypothetical protein